MSEERDVLRGAVVMAAAAPTSLSAGADPDNGTFAIHRGTRIDHWLSQSTARGE